MECERNPLNPLRRHRITGNVRDLAGVEVQSRRTAHQFPRTGGRFFVPRHDTATIPHAPPPVTQTRHMSKPRTVTIRDVELVSVGDHTSGRGRTSITEDDLGAILDAEADGLVDNAPIKLGHFSSLNADLGDGAPAYGWIRPTGIRPGKQTGKPTLVGDIVGMPSKLAEVMPTAYRRRSVEIAWNVKTAGGKVHKAALVGLALLGKTPPAVKGLDDVVALYSGDVAPDVEEVTSTVVIDGVESEVAVAMLSAAIAAGAPIDQVDAIAAAAGARDTADVPTATPDPVDDGGKEIAGPAGGPTPGGIMTEEELRAALKLEADADVDAHLRKILEERAGDPVVAGSDPVAAPAAPAAPAAEAAPAAAVAADAEKTGDLVTLSADDHASLMEAVALVRDQKRGNALDTAIREGRISPAERSHFSSLMDTAEDATIALLGKMTPRFPTAEVGDERAGETLLSDDESAAFDEFERTVFGLDR